MKKIIVFSMFIILLLFVSSQLDSRINKNLEITEGIDVLYVEIEIYETVESMLTQDYYDISYGIFKMEEEVVSFYAANEFGFEDLNIDKQVVINQIYEYNNEVAVDKYLNLFITGDKLVIAEFYEQIDNHLIETNNSMGLDSRLSSLDDSLLYSSMLPVYRNIINVIILFITSIVLLYAFINFNNKSKSIAINKLYGVSFLEKLDLIFILVSIIAMFTLNIYYSFYLLIFICTIYLIKYLLYYRCSIIKSISGKPIINNFESLILLYNSVIKILIFSFYVLFLFLIPRITEYYSTYELWNKEENYSLTNNEFIE
jgi:hypothetical protein